MRDFNRYDVALALEVIRTCSRHAFFVTYLLLEGIYIYIHRPWTLHIDTHTTDPRVHCM